MTLATGAPTSLRSAHDLTAHPTVSLTMPTDSDVLPNDVSPAERARQNAPSIRSRDARARRTLGQMRQGFLDLVAHQPVEAITVDDIIAAAGVSRSTFYRHFATKEALVDHVAETEIEDMVASAFPLLSSIDAAESCIALVRYVDERRNLWSILLNGGASGVMRSRFVNLAINLGAAQVGGDDQDLPAELGAAFGVAATVEVLSWWLRQTEPVPLEKVAELVERLSVRPTLYMAAGHPGAGPAKRA